MNIRFDELFAHLTNCGLRVKEDEAVAPFTTMAVGGSARLLIDASSGEDLKTAIAGACNLDLPYLVIGKGSNLVFADGGYEGLIILNNSSSIEILERKASVPAVETTTVRYDKTGSGKFKIDEYLKKVKAAGSVTVRADSGWRLAALSKELYKDNIVGLEWFAGIPATVGGGVYMNMHGGPLFFGSLVERVTVFDGNNVRTLSREKLNFDYDYSALHDKKEAVLCADLSLWRGDVIAASEFSKEWAKEKAFQPRRSAGCVFQNLTEKEQARLKLPTSSMGYVIDKILSMKGAQIGGAIVSEKHAAFIENTGRANAQDVYDLVCLIRRKAREMLDLDLKLEIQFIGIFKQE